MRDQDSETDDPRSPDGRVGGGHTQSDAEIDTRNQQVQDVLEKWEDRYLNCEDPSLEMLGVNDPELYEAIRNQISDRKALYAFLRLPIEPEWRDEEQDADDPVAPPRGANEAPAHQPSAASPQGPEPSTIGRYRVTGVLGQGGFGRVYLAYDADLDRPVAIKVTIAERLGWFVDVKAYLNEARALARLSHPNIVPVYDVGHTDDQRFYVVSRYMHGGDLASRMARGRYSVAEAAELVAVIADALHYAHGQDLFHRDIKPANILLDAAGTPSLADFGLALKDENVGKAEGIIGTAAYMSPEQARGEGHLVDGRSDIFSLGIVFYELLTGRRPFRGNSRSEVMHKIINHEPRPPRQIDDKISRELERICMKALYKKASERYLSACDLAEDLRHFLKTAHANEPAELTSRATPSPPASSSGERNTTIASGQSDSSGPMIAIVPKGLCSFDENDADFFLELLPGPRDRAGIPDGLRFWKTRIEATEPDKTFAVGMIYGPSGSGKSSLVKAGLLPLLREHVTTVYLEASGSETEPRLRRLIHKTFPGLPADAGLVESFSALRRGRHLSADHKVLVILDQFEQWLFGRGSERSNELVAALRQCDGQHVQVLCLVRDDFWMATTRFMSELEIDLVPDRNVAAVDLFDPKHARKVLKSYGRAYETLPARDADLTREQRAFLDQAVSGLANDGKVVPVRLSLFAEMVKGKPWTPATLKEVGGMDGVGVRFLEETFSTPRSAPQHRYHQKAARAVLKSLLPDADLDIKGRTRSMKALREDSGYANRPGDFDELIRILDTHLRLITPVDPEGATDGDTPGERGYQLTHDYLVHSLRDWLTRKQRETRPGRAELLLAERASLWIAKPEPRYLPSVREWIEIRSMTRRKDWTESQRQVMTRAGRRHGARLVVLTAVLALLTAAGVVINDAIASHSLLDSLSTANVEKVPEILSQLARYPRWIYSRELRRRAALPDFESPARLAYGLALLADDPSQLEFLKIRLIKANPTEMTIVRNGLERDYRGALKPWLWSELIASKPDDHRILPVACMLARYDANNPNWMEVSAKVAGAMLESKREHEDGWREGLKPLRVHLIEPIAAIQRDHARSEDEHRIAMAVLADYAEDRPGYLLEFLLDAEPKTFVFLYPVVAKRGRDVFDDLKATVKLSNGPTSKEQQARRRSRAAAALIRLGHADEVWPLLVLGEDPQARSEVVTSLCALGVEPGVLMDELKTNIENAKRRTTQADVGVKKNGYLFDPETSKRRAVIMALAEYPKKMVLPPRRDDLVNVLMDLHRCDRDAGVHSAAELILERWGEGPTSKTEPGHCETDRSSERRWSVNPAGHTMIHIEGPVDFDMGSPPADPNHQKEEVFHRRKIPRRFAIASKEVTIAQFQEYATTVLGAAHDYDKNYSPDPRGPQIHVTWIDAVQYCNWLSDKEKLRRCYEPNDQGKFAIGMRVNAEAVARGGYRLPTEAEWEYACRAGSLSSGYYGEPPTLADFYCWSAANSGFYAHRCGTKLPNDLGVFDMLGNVLEWCHDGPREPDPMTIDEITAETISVPHRNIRSDKFTADPKSMRSPGRGWFIATERRNDLGFRPARTLP